MDKNLEKKINVCKKMGGKVEENGDDMFCEGVNQSKFQEEIDKEE